MDFGKTSRRKAEHPGRSESPSNHLPSADVEEPEMPEVPPAGASTINGVVYQILWGLQTLGSFRAEAAFRV